MNVALSRHWKDFVAGQVASGRYSNASEVIFDALRRLEAAGEDEPPWLLAALDEGLASPSTPYVKPDLASLRKRGMAGRPLRSDRKAA
jgi:putative addiction module CopG family antidote